MRKTHPLHEIRCKSTDEIARIAEAGLILRQIFAGLQKQSFLSCTTHEIDAYIQHSIRACRARSAFETVYGYAHAACISINDEAVHGIPSKRRRINEGDIVSIDIGVVKNGYFADACRTYCIHPVPAEKQAFVHSSRQILDYAIESLIPGQPVNETGRIIELEAVQHGYAVVHECTGHGVGFALHEAPVIPHYYDAKQTLPLREGMVLALEPVFTMHPVGIHTVGNGWTVKTVDGSVCVQFEETVALTQHGPIVLT